MNKHLADPGSGEIITLVVGQMSTNCYIVADHTLGSAIVIDPGDAPDYISDRLEGLKLKPKLLLVTHGHFDHLLAARALQLNYQIPFLVHAADIFLVERQEEAARHFLGLTSVDPPPQVTRRLRPQEILEVGTVKLKVLSTPGHTPGSVSFYFEGEKAVFVGDLIFAGGGVGRTDFSYSQPAELVKSLDKILHFPTNTYLYPGHGPAVLVEQAIRQNAV